MIRPARVVAIARLDLKSELRGRGGWVLPAIIAALLLPIAAAPAPKLGDLLPEIGVRGDVPPSIRALPRVIERPDAPTIFRQAGARLEIRGPVPARLRDVLDGDQPAVRVISVETPTRVPGRTLLLALVSASGLTGAVASSIAGERTHRTLVALLTSSVGRGEIVLGKWLAWGGLGLVAALSAAAGALLGGRVAPGWWMLDFPLVPLALAATGLWLARNATDVVGGTATALRVLPTAVALLGIAAWFVGRWSPELGAAVPLGGALVAAGDTWRHPLPNAIAAATTGLLIVAALRGTARDLEESPPAGPREGHLPVQLGLMAAIALGPTLGPLLWAPGGNPDLIAGLDPGLGRMAAAMGLGLLAAVGLAQRPTAPRPPRPIALLVALAAGVALAAATPWTQAAAGTSALDRLPSLLPLAPAVVVALGEEVAFRGWLIRRAGPVVAGIAWMALRGLGDPLGALLTGAAATGFAMRWGVGTAIAFRIAASAFLPT